MVWFQVERWVDEWNDGMLEWWNIGMMECGYVVEPECWTFITVS